MIETDDGASLAQAWLARLSATGPGVRMLQRGGPGTIAALGALAAEALANERSLLLVTADDRLLSDISNAIDINLRPLCLVLPAADHVRPIALRATLSLLKSRLARAGDDAEGPAWLAQRQRLAKHADLWRQCVDWNGRNVDHEAWPAELERLFPVRILPMSLAVRLAVPSDWVLVAEPEQLPDDCRGPWSGAQRTAHLIAPAQGGGLASVDPARRERAELEVLTQELAELELELATAQAEIAEFTRRYQTLIGTRMSALDELRAELATRRAQARADDAEAARAAQSAWARAEQSRRESTRFEQLVRETARPFAPSGSIKKLFRKLAQKIHPDRARDEHDRAWRTQLMTEANRAYQAGDEAALLEVLALWQEGARHGPGRDGGIAGDEAGSLSGQLARLRRRITEIETELNRLFGSRLYELFTATNIARRAKRDLLQEMADRLDADIALVQAQLA